MSGIDREKLQGLISNWRFGKRVAAHGIDRGLEIAARDLEILLLERKAEPKLECELMDGLNQQGIPVRIWRNILPVIDVIHFEKDGEYFAELHYEAELGDGSGQGMGCRAETEAKAFCGAIIAYIKSFGHSDLIDIEKITITEDVDPFSTTKMWGFSIKERPPSLLAWSGVEKTITEAAKIAISEMITHLNLRLREKHGKES